MRVKGAECIKSCRKRVLDKGNSKSNSPEVGRGFVLFQEERIGVLECKGPGALVETQLGPGGGQTVPRGVVRGRRGGLSDMRQVLVDILKNHIYGLWGQGELGRGAQKVVAVSGEDKWLGAGWWPGHADPEETNSGVCPIKRPRDPSPQGGCELLEAGTDRHAQHRAHAWPAPWGTAPVCTATLRPA